MSQDPTERGRGWLGALVLNIVSGLVGLGWAIVFVLVGGVFGAGALFGRGGDASDAALTMAAGLAYILTAAVVTIGPFAFGVFFALRRRAGAVRISYAIAGITIVLPWAVLFIGF